MPTITILHTNDFHNRLTPLQAARLAKLRKALGSSGLLLDAGDAISAGNLTYKPAGEPILERMSEAGYDAMTLGNREFHLTEAGFCAKVRCARFPVLCANVRARDEKIALPVQPTLFRSLAGDIRVGIFGLTVPMITERMLVRKISAYVFDDPLRKAAELVPAHRAQCDLLICLSHIGLGKDRELAAAVPGIDLIIGGHTHAVLENGEWVKETLIVQAGYNGHFLGTVTVEMTQGDRRFEAKIVSL
ncbi:MAG TPA: metallophosphatase [Chthonomonadales bacterium]|nr:metallophosphatase [Chthonomonadales bacterium]